MILEKIPILNNNYVWVLYDSDKYCIIIDPGSSDRVIETIKKNKWHPVAILLTHAHIDHTGGVLNIKKKYPNIIVYGPYETRKYNINIIVNGGEVIRILKRNFFVFFTPGHTMGHVSYYSPPYIFCGDVLFSGGCGNVEKNNYLDMYNSIKKISSLPNSTFLCCTHEYTFSNIKFSLSILPNDIELNRYYLSVEKKIKIDQCTLPSLIFYEKKINLFLRTGEFFLKQSIGMDKNSNSFETFVKLRLMKNLY
ncbi:hydroxyacylglutathione hydrolase [Buchnera aphidicola]|uniref:hydroxyacylglutathione hydrolase n=1 Tax=Buchnera aphidicola TaxID=9 RepID=UPI0034648BC6